LAGPGRLTKIKLRFRIAPMLEMASRTAAADHQQTLGKRDELD
jgi:hypothetical protein